MLADLNSPAPLLLLPEPELHRHHPAVVRLLAGRGTVLGPTVPVGSAAESLRWARPAQGRLADPYAAEPYDCDARLPELLLLADRPLVGLMAERRLAPPAGLTEKQTARLAETLLAWLQSGGGSALEVAAQLAVHPQTARQRLHRIRELFGPALGDPDARFELEVALRARHLS